VIIAVVFSAYIGIRKKRTAFAPISFFVKHQISWINKSNFTQTNSISN